MKATGIEGESCGLFATISFEALIARKRAPRAPEARKAVAHWSAHPFPITRRFQSAAPPRWRNPRWTRTTKVSGADLVLVQHAIDRAAQPARQFILTHMVQHQPGREPQRDRIGDTFARDIWR